MHKVSIPNKILKSLRHYRSSPSFRFIITSSYITKLPIIDTTAAANSACAAVEDVGPIFGAALVIDVVAYTRLKSKVELL